MLLESYHIISNRQQYSLGAALKGEIWWLSILGPCEKNLFCYPESAAEQKTKKQINKKPNALAAPFPTLVIQVQPSSPAD